MSQKNTSKLIPIDMSCSIRKKKRQIHNPNDKHKGQAFKTQQRERRTDRVFQCPISPTITQFIN
jgi:hypothetical protein